jgi:hypothetical protein
MLTSQVILDGLVFPEIRRDGPLHAAGLSPARISYSFHNTGTAALADHESEVTGWVRWSDDARDIVRAALSELEQVINVDFVEQGANRAADLPIGLAEAYRDGDRAGQVYYSFSYSGAELTDFSSSVSLLQDADIPTFYHELGHALGLKHPFEGPDILPKEFDNFGYTIMSYDRSYNPAKVIFDTTPAGGEWRRLDVIALQSIWGPADAKLSFAIGNFGSEAGGWRSQDRHPRLMADLDGDGQADIVGFGANRVLTALVDTDGSFQPAGGGIANFAGAQGWASQDGFPRQLGDVNGDGRADIIGFGARATFTALSDGAGGFGAFRAAMDNFSTADGWRSEERFPRIVADVNGDGLDDIIGFGAAATFTALARGDGTFAGFTRAIDNFARDQGWRSNDAFPRLAGDVNGDGLDDIIGFGATATYTAISQGDGTFFRFRIATEDFSRAGGWRNEDLTPRLVGDLNGDGVVDIVGLGPDIAWVALGNGFGRFQPQKLLSTDFTASAGWTDGNVLPRQLADVDGDGLDDLVGFSEDGVLTRLTVLEADAETTRGTASAPDPTPSPVDWFDFG